MANIIYRSATLPAVNAAGSNKGAPLTNAEVDGNLIGIIQDVSLKANASNPSFTGTVAGVSSSMVGLGNCNNTSDAAKPVSDLTVTALNTKQASLVSGSNIQTINSGNILNSGNINLQVPLVSGTNIKTVGGITILGSGDIQIAKAVFSSPSNGIRLALSSLYLMTGTNVVGNVYYLPTATQGQTIEFIDSYGDWAVNQWTLVYDTTGGPIMGKTENFTVNKSNANFKLVYVDATAGWRIA